MSSISGKESYQDLSVFDLFQGEQDGASTQDSQDIANLAGRVQSSSSLESNNGSKEDLDLLPAVAEYVPNEGRTRLAAPNLEIEEKSVANPLAEKDVNVLKFVGFGVGMLAGAFGIARIASIVIPVLSLIALVFAAYKYRDHYFDKIFNAAEIAQIEKYAKKVKGHCADLMLKFA